jgi:hypothetical protein
MFAPMSPCSDEHAIGSHLHHALVLMHDEIPESEKRTWHDVCKNNKKNQRIKAYHHIKSIFCTNFVPL